MRDLKRNTQKVYFKLYLGEQEIIDQYGNSSGSYIPVYGDLMSADLVVSPNKGSTETEQFGAILDYDRTMTTANVKVQIDENSVLWLDGADTNGPWNYVVKKRAPWKNSVQFAISQVAVSAYKEYQDLLSRAAALAEVTPNAEV
jgi:hypothetical protein